MSPERQMFMGTLRTFLDSVRDSSLDQEAGEKTRIGQHKKAIEGFDDLMLGLDHKPYDHYSSILTYHPFFVLPIVLWMDFDVGCFQPQGLFSKDFLVSWIYIS